MSVAERLARVIGRDAPMGPATFTGHELRAARRFLGLSQAQAAEVIGCHPNSVSHWERGVSDPQNAYLRRAVREFIDRSGAIG